MGVMHELWAGNPSAWHIAHLIGEGVGRGVAYDAVVEKKCAMGAVPWCENGDLLGVAEKSCMLCFEGVTLGFFSFMGWPRSKFDQIDFQIY